MSTYNNLADFSTEGFNIGKDAKVMSYLHGLSDFWVYMFEDASKINMLMEINAITASDVYNKFLQLTSVLSLEGISVLTNTQVKLLLISEDDLVADTLQTYTLPTYLPIKYARYLVNRAFLPTTTLENEIDYFLDDVGGKISFARPVGELGFPFRTLPSGKKEYALWAIDAKIDDQLIYSYYAKLIDINPTTSTDNFKNFVYGMYYLFVNGPHLDTVRRGLNIALGIPLARDTETVLEIRKYLNTDQWLVITDLNSYLIPYGLQPSVQIDDTLSTGQEIADWIEVKDYNNDGEWWVNLMLPGHLMPHPGVIAGVEQSRYMTAGSYADWLMRNYLKTHTFLVNVKTINFKNLQTFEQLFSIIHQVKPSYTTPIYVWTVPVEDEILELVETFQLDLNADSCELLTDGVERFYRGNTTNPQLRGCCPVFIRMSAASKLDDNTGYSPELNGKQRTFQGGTVTGFVTPQASYRELTGEEDAWMRALRRRDNEQYMPRRGRIDFIRDRNPNQIDGQAVQVYQKVFPTYRMVALHTTTYTDVKEKFAACNQEVSGDYLLPLLKPELHMDMINEHAINDEFEDDYFDFMMANFNFLFTRGTHGAYLGPLFPPASQYVFVPDTGNLRRGDFILFTRINSTHCGAYWMTRNFDLETTPYVRHEAPDVLTIETSGIPTRGGALMGSPYYQLRNTNFSISYNSDNAIDDQAIDEETLEAASINVVYEDNFNPLFTKDRSGTPLVARRVFR